MKMLFSYPSEYSLLPEYEQHSGSPCEIIGRKADCDDVSFSTQDGYGGLEPMFRVRFNDGFEGDVFESELTPLSLV